MKIVFDTHIVLDVLLIREPYAQMSMNLFDAVVSQTIEGYLCATTITTIDYLVAKRQDKQKSRELIHRLLGVFSVAEVNGTILAKAVVSDFSDFEDAVLYQAGCHVKVDGFVTRNAKDFKTADLPIYSPDELWQII
ncbi:MAG: PIN domain-containing protein [Methylovulum sp.]|nr:PIN domain-containing protein [Methylovulum sp.]